MYDAAYREGEKDGLVACPLECNLSRWPQRAKRAVPSVGRLGRALVVGVAVPPSMNWFGVWSVGNAAAWTADRIRYDL